MILAATGMRREAAIVARAGLVPVISGGDAGRLRGLLEEQVAQARAIVSIGIAGALSPDLGVGDVVIGDTVTKNPPRNGEGDRSKSGGGAPLHVAQRLPVPLHHASHGPPPRSGEDFEWIARLLVALPSARRGAVCGSDAMVITAAAKARLYERCRIASPLVIDMESHVAAEVARQHNLPFAFIRVISDRADQDLPTAVLHGIKPDGRMAILPVVAALARNPRQFPALIRTARDTDRAMRVLLGACDALARRGIGFPDRG